MTIFKGQNKAFLSKGNALPCEFYKGDINISGYDIRTFSGEKLDIYGTYNSKPEKVRINGGFVPGKNLFDKSVSPSSAICNENPFYGYGVIVLENDVIIKTLKPNTQYTISYTMECVALPDTGALTSAPAGFALHSFSGARTIPLYTSSFNYTVGNTEFFSKTFTTPTGVNIPENEYVFLCYAGIYKDDYGNRYSPKIRFYNVQIEEGSTATQFEAFKTPTTPVLCWNQEDISVPYTLRKQEDGNDYLLMENGAVLLFSAENGIYTSLDISDTDFGVKLLSLKTLYPSTSANISEGSLDVTLKTFN